MLVPISLFLHTVGLYFGVIELVKYAPTDHNLTHSESSLKIRRILKINAEPVNNKDADYISLQSKDTAYMSEKNYAGFRRGIQKIKGITVTSLYGIKKLQILMKNFYKITMNSMGAYVEPKEKIQIVLTKLYEKYSKRHI